MNKIDALIGERIKARRGQLKMARRALAERIGVTSQQLQKYETGINRVSASRLWSIAEHLDVDVVHFFDNIKDGTSAASPQADVLAGQNMDQDVIDILNAYMQLSPEERKKALSHVKSMTPEQTSA